MKMHSLCLMMALSLMSLTGHSEEAPVPEWALPGSATHKQVSPPQDFHRPSRTVNEPIGIFEAQTDVGAAVINGSSTYDATTEQYSITSAGYNIWYVRDEFRFLWKKMKGDISLAADTTFPDADGFFDRKVVLVIRQSLDDDSTEAVVALHGDGMLQLAMRPEKGARIKDMEYRIGSRGGLPGGKSPDELVIAHAKRIGIEKHGDSFALYASLQGEPMHQFGKAIELHLSEPFYVGIGFCSHIPDKADTSVFSNVMLANKAGKVR
ncbi:MAG TPA: hypothetical protein VHL14_14120 [Steroidobacteraceae bacterium]|nr:hypothetical protein [Steroidobacteraceae bacterium]